MAKSSKRFEQKYNECAASLNNKRAALLDDAVMIALKGTLFGGKPSKIHTPPLLVSNIRAAGRSILTGATGASRFPQRRNAIHEDPVLDEIGSRIAEIPCGVVPTIIACDEYADIV
jgi:hypothetical protein